MIDVDHEKIGLRAGRQAAKVFTAQSARTADGGGVENGGRIGGSNVVRLNPCDLHGKTHFLDYIVWRHVGPDAEVDASIPISAEILKGIAVAREGRGTMRNGGAAFREKIEVAPRVPTDGAVLVQEDRMADGGVRSEEADLA